jgi:hypothetical protein
VQRLSGAAATHEWNSSSELVYSVLMWSEQEMNDWAEDFGAEIASALD